jgi:hypothetical protein
MTIDWLLGIPLDMGSMARERTQRERDSVKFSKERERGTGKQFLNFNIWPTIVFYIIQFLIQGLLGSIHLLHFTTCPW